MNLINNNRRGQGMVEYIIIVVVVGIFCIGIFMALGKGVQTQVATSTNKLVGTMNHDDAVLNLGVDARVNTETARSNKMNHE